MKVLRKFLTVLLTMLLLLGVIVTAASATSVESESNDGYVDEYEDDYGYSSRFSEEGARIYLTVIGVLLGILLPAVPLTVFVVKLIRKKAECELVDFLIIGLSAVWLAVGIAIFVLIL